MTTAADLARQLKAKRCESGWLAKCPAHNDHRASLSIGEGENGRLLLKCHAGCTFDQIIKSAGVEPDRPNGHDRGAKPRIVAEYNYRDARGEVLFRVVRYAPKDFKQRRPNSNGGWIWGRGDLPALPYRLPELLNSTEEIYICEGEKDCDNLAKLGLTATTNPGGADKDGEGGKKWLAGFARYFEGRHAILIPDNDDAGRRHVRAVARKIRKAASIKILELPGLPPKGDVSDWLANGGTRERLEELAAAAPYWGARKKTKTLTIRCHRLTSPSYACHPPHGKRATSRPKTSCSVRSAPRPAQRSAPIPGSAKPCSDLAGRTQSALVATICTGKRIGKAAFCT
jgi:putative DNA primase/helicase